MSLPSHSTVESLFNCQRSAEARRIIAKLQRAGFVAYLAGGCVRDALLGMPPKDFDVATDATPAAVRELFGKRRTLAFGASFGVIGVLPDPEHREQLQREGLAVEPTEVATFRSDGEYSDGRRPDSVHFGNAEQDALRRDFTINGMFYDPATHQVIDYVGGRADMEKELLRTIGDPGQRFDEDKLRMLRAIRFATVLGFTKEPRTFEAIRQHADAIGVVSAERIGTEMRRVVVADRAVEGLTQLLRTGLARQVWPGLQQLDRERAGRLLGCLPERSFPAAMACVLLAAPEPARMLEVLAKRWRLSNEERRMIAAAIERWPVIANADERKWSEVQPVLIDRDAATILNVAEACVEARTDGRGPVSADRQAIRLAREAWQRPRKELDPEPLLTGNDLKGLGYRPGPEFRQILERVRAAQLDGELTSQQQAIELARSIADEPHAEGPPAEGLAPSSGGDDRPEP